MYFHSPSDKCGLKARAKANSLIKHESWKQFIFPPRTNFPVNLTRFMFYACWRRHDILPTSPDGPWRQTMPKKPRHRTNRRAANSAGQKKKNKAGQNVRIRTPGSVFLFVLELQTKHIQCWGNAVTVSYFSAEFYSFLLLGFFFPHGDTFHQKTLDEGGARAALITDDGP